MRKDVEQVDEEHHLEPLEDKTEPLLLRSKRTERAEKRQRLREKKNKVKSSVTHILDLPHELVLEILYYCRPSTLFNLVRVSKAYQAFIRAEEESIAYNVCDFRYRCLRKCFHTPLLLKDVDTDAHASLQSMDRVELKNALTKPYQHVHPPDPTLICTCFACLLRWTSLNIIPDFAHWQENLDAGEPIPIIPRGKQPGWNRKLVGQHAGIVHKAIVSPLWHSRLLQEHLRSTMRAISRHAANKGNKRRRFRLTQEDVDAETDHFLERSGPPTVDIPYMRDNYYMLEAFLPNRAWNGEQARWMYVPQEQHETDVKIVVSWAKWRARIAETQRNGMATS
ncbi:hypothetical protein G7054_g14027 [Neopestalotiopsis clavispora]|nr:hypothetical protein G7054_g14027 [Neopestalotiopsis clavispora]